MEIVKLSRRGFLRKVGAGLTMFAMAGCGESNEKLGKLPKERPNIIFIMSDDHAAAAIS